MLKNGSNNNCSPGSSGGNGSGNGNNGNGGNERGGDSGEILRRGRSGSHGRSSRDAVEVGSTSSSNTGAPCGACKFLRRKCISDCVFAPYFGSDQGAARFAAVHKVFGASNVSKLLMHHVPPHKRHEAVLTICLEAQARISDPVHGCVSTIYALQQQVAALQAELAMVQAQLMNSRLAAANVANVLQHHQHMGVIQQGLPPQFYANHPSSEPLNMNVGMNMNLNMNVNSLRMSSDNPYASRGASEVATSTSTNPSSFHGMNCDMDLSSALDTIMPMPPSHEDPPDQTVEFHAFAHSLFHRK